MQTFQSPTVGQLERKTQNRIVTLLRDTLGYDYLGNWEDRENNSNVEEEYLRAFLVKSGHSETLIVKAIEELKKTVNRSQMALYDLNKETYGLLRYGVSVREGLGDKNTRVAFIDWKHPESNHFAIAEEVTIRGNRVKRPDIVLYVNGIAFGVIELKRSTVSVSEGIRQNIGNQKDDFIKNFFATMQLVMAGNDTEGLRYGTTNTEESYYLSWKEAGSEETLLLDRSVMQLCRKDRFLEMIHDFIVFDSGIKKTCRHNQYFGVKKAQEYMKRREGGIIWHTQGSGKSLTMVWLAKWIRENITDARVLLLTDRTELDEQLEKVFIGVDEKSIKRIRPQNGLSGGRMLMETLNKKEDWLMCALIHKFGLGDKTGADEEVNRYVTDMRSGFGSDFSAKGNLFVFVDECHRTHTGALHEAMKEMLPDAVFVGFTGTPLLKVEKKADLLAQSNRVWGDYIHTYKYDEAVADKVVLDLRYEARRVAQRIVEQDKIDEWFETRTKGLTDVAKSELKRRWGTMQSLLSSKGRLEKVVFDIVDDFYKKDRLSSGRGNAMLVASSIYEACQYYEIFQTAGFTKCAVVTSYEPDALSTDTREYAIYRQMIEDFKKNYGAITKKSGESETDAFERQVKKIFIDEPGRMQLLIVVDKLLTGFDAPPATYLYIDRNMQDHGLFQAICRVNRLDGEDKEYGYIVDYRDLFKKLESAVTEYTGGALDGFDAGDITGLLKDRLGEGKKDLEDALEIVRALCEPVQPPKDNPSYIRYFCGDTENPYALKENEMKRVKLYKSVSHLLRAYADVANEMTDAGFDEGQINAIQREVRHYEQVRGEVKLASGDYIDLRKYEKDMRMLINNFVGADASDKISTFDDMTIVDLLLQKGDDALNDLPEAVRKSREAVQETIENNIRKLIIDEMPTNPKYYNSMSELLSELIRKRKQEDVEYTEYLEQIKVLCKKVKDPMSDTSIVGIDTPAKRALYDNLGKDTAKAQAVHEAVMRSRYADWRGDFLKEKAIKIKVRETLLDIPD
ncbi:MAG: HsdR family type I site-specific deoxyribonuclease, partial [Candidatus Moraniibacteriota bacterium]